MSGIIRDPNTPSNGVGKTGGVTGVDRVEREDEHECGGQLVLERL